MGASHKVTIQKFLLLSVMLTTSACSGEEMIITYNIFETTRKSNECFDYNVHAFPTEHERVIGSPFEISLFLIPNKEVDLSAHTISIKSWEIKNLENGTSVYVDSKDLKIIKESTQSSISVHSKSMDISYTDHVVNIELELSFCNPPTRNLSLDLKFLHKKEKNTLWDVLMGV